MQKAAGAKVTFLHSDDSCLLFFFSSCLPRLFFFFPSPICSHFGSDVSPSMSIWLCSFGAGAQWHRCEMHLRRKVSSKTETSHILYHRYCGLYVQKFADIIRHVFYFKRSDLADCLLEFAQGFGIKFHRLELQDWKMRNYVGKHFGSLIKRKEKGKSKVWACGHKREKPIMTCMLKSLF